MPKFTEDTCKNFSPDDYDSSELTEDFKNAVKDDGCRIGDLFFYYQTGLFSYDIYSFKDLLWVYPSRAAKQGKSAEQFHNDKGILVFYTKEGKRFDLTFKTPYKAESLFSFLVPTLQQFQVVAGVANELITGMEEGGVIGFKAALEQLRKKYEEQQRQGDPHHLTFS